LRGSEYGIVSRKLTWGEDRVSYYDRDGRLKSFPVNITDLIQVDAFTRISEGRSALRVDDLLTLRELLDRLGRLPGDSHGV